MSDLVRNLEDRFSHNEVHLFQVNELDLEPTSENLPDDYGEVDLSNVSEMDDVNIHILQELEDDF